MILNPNPVKFNLLMPDHSLWKPPLAGRKLYLKYAQTQAWGVQNELGLVALVEARGIPLECKSYANLSIKKAHLLLIESGVLINNKFYYWQGITEFNNPTFWVGAACGKGISNMWKEFRS